MVALVVGDGEHDLFDAAGGGARGCRRCRGALHAPLMARARDAMT